MTGLGGFRTFGPVEGETAGVYSITSSARARINGGMGMPSTFAHATASQRSVNSYPEEGRQKGA